MALFGQQGTRKTRYKPFFKDWKWGGITRLQKTASVYLCIRLCGVAQEVEVSVRPSTDSLSLIRMIVWRLVLKSRASAATVSPCWRR